MTSAPAESQAWRTQLKTHRTRLACLAVTLVTLIAACAPTSDPTASGTNAPDEASDRTVAMPDLICLDLQEAQDKMQSLTGTFFAVESYDASGAGRAQLIDRNWTVVEQSPLAGVGVVGTPSIGAVKDDEAVQCGAAKEGAAQTPAVRAESTPVSEAASGTPDTGLSPSQQNALRSAESYLDFSGFSRQGLIDQLSSDFGDKYTVADAEIAVGALVVDWRAQAVRSAESYLDFSGFSRQGLIDQLSSDFGDKYTVEEATVAVESLAVDWRMQAVRSAESYLDFSGFSCQGLVDQLSSDFGDKYALDEATFAASEVGLC